MRKGDKIIYTVRGQDIAATILRVHRDGSFTLRADYDVNAEGTRGQALGLIFKRVVPVSYRPA